jgi:beta-glucosidase
MVLLKNEEETLPLLYDQNVALLGNAVVHLVDGASGSAKVNNADTVNLLEGMLKKQSENKVMVNKTLADAYSNVEGYVPTLEELKEIRKESDVAVYTITRNSKDGADRDDKAGDYYLSTDEVKALDDLVEAGFEDIVVIINSGNVIDTTKLLAYDQVKAILMAWLPGQYGGAAIADILVGDITPSGKLADTLAKRYKDYPTFSTFSKSNSYVEYEEDIFVGYRYFETFDPSYEKVNFEFGFGLSYTTFEYSDVDFEFTDEDITVTFTITNTGKYIGKETAQLYFAAPDGDLGTPAKELCAFQKTGWLYPGDSQTITMTVDMAQLASYDDTGKIQKSAYVIKEGDYEFFLGSSIKQAQESGLGYIYDIDENIIVEQLSTQMKARLLKQRLLADGSYEDIYSEHEIVAPTLKTDWVCVEAPAQVVMFDDLRTDPSKMGQFLAQLSIEKLVRIVYSHSAKVEGAESTLEPDNVLGLPYTTTADGTAGLRLSRSTTEYPVASALACTWNPDLLGRMGTEVAIEAKKCDIQYWLAPSVNIHRDPLSGANFESFSEDPYLSGMLASALISSVQENGVGCAIKHLVGNEKESRRDRSDTRVSERALREIYLEPFRIAVEEADPWLIMTSYNLVNGVKTATNQELLINIVRGEWGYKGVICTDHKNNTTLIDELIAGSDLKLPTGDRAATIKAVEEGKITRELLEEHAARVLALVLKTGKTTGITSSIYIDAESKSVFKSVDFVSKSEGIQIEDCSDEGGTKNTSYNEKDQYLNYNLIVGATGEYEIVVRVASPEAAGAFDIYVDGNLAGSFVNDTQTADWQVWADSENTVKIKLDRGYHTLKILFTESGLNFNTLTFSPVKAETAE